MCVIHQSSNVCNPPGIFSTEVALPKGLTCAHCVLQWRYVGGGHNIVYLGDTLPFVFEVEPYLSWG